MSKVTTNLIKGVIGRLKRKAVHKDNSRLGWVKKKIIKHQEDKQLKSLVLDKLTIFYKRPYELLHTYQDIFEKELYRFHSSSTSPLILDCGANIGISVLYFKNLYPHAELIVFEPDENNFKILSKNVEANKLTNVTIHQAAVWTSNGFISFEANESEASKITETVDNSSIKVKSLKLADILNDKPQIDFLKIDIEGAEYQVMMDIANQLGKVQHLFVEYHGKANEIYKLNKILSILEKTGFSVYIRNAADNLYHPFIEKQTESIYDVQLNIFCYRNV